MADHQAVLVREALEGLAIIGDGWYVDGTYGRGGHSAEIVARLGEQGRLFALDKDPEAVAHGRARFAAEPRFTIEHGDFESLHRHVQPWLQGHALGGVLLDLGVSSPQLDVADRGFSITHDGPLDMRMDTTVGQNAMEWLMRVEESELRRVLFRYGEEPRARQIASRFLENAQTEIVDLIGSQQQMMKTGSTLEPVFPCKDVGVFDMWDNPTYKFRGHASWI